MILKTKILTSKDNYFFENSIVYSLTGSLELAKLFSMLCSNQSSFGTYVEKLLYNVLPFDIIPYDDIGKRVTTVQPRTDVLKVDRNKLKIAGKVPDIIIVDNKKKTIIIYESKIKADKSDTKKIDGDIAGHIKMEKDIQKKCPKYKVSFKILSFLPATGMHLETWKKRGADTITGKDFCYFYGISYTDIIAKITNNQQSNLEELKLLFPCITNLKLI